MTKKPEPGILKDIEIPKNVVLEPVEYLEFENTWLRVRLTRQELAAAEQRLSQIRDVFANRYGLVGSWRVDSELRALVPGADDARRVPASSPEDQDEIRTVTGETTKGESHE